MSRHARRSGDQVAGMEQLLAAKEIAVFCGSGGVGKTTAAAATALMATTRLGGKVLVLTVDPARRLATALGLEALGNRESRVADDVIRAAGVEPRGELWAAMLDTKQGWDDLVLRHAPDEATAVRILSNRLYTSLTARFVQSHDYVAMERLYELHQSGAYDLIVVDTPPTRHAIDFLEAPNRMADFFGGRLLRWLTLPYRVGGSRGSRMINVASRPFYQVADRILGSKFLEDIAEFFLEFQSMYDGFVARAKAVEALLHDRRTTFAVVTTLEAAPLAEAERFMGELAQRRFHLGALVLNRTLPDYLLDRDGDAAAEAFDERAAQIAARLAGGTDATPTDARGSDALRETERTERVLHTVAASFRSFAVVAKREAELRAELARVPDVTVRVPTLTEEIGDVKGLVRMGQAVFGAPETVPGRTAMGGRT